MFVTTFPIDLWYIFVIMIVTTYLKYRKCVKICKNYDRYLFLANAVIIVFYNLYCKFSGG